MWHVRNHRDRVTVSRSIAAPNVLHLDRDQPTCLAPVDRNTFVVYRGRQRLGDVIFHDGDRVWGWRYWPRVSGQSVGRKLYANPVGAAETYVHLDEVFGHTEATVFA